MKTLLLPQPPKVEMDFSDAQLTGFAGRSALSQAADRLTQAEQ